MSDTKLQKLKNLLGQYVEIDVTKVKNDKVYKHYEGKPKPFITRVVGINPMNCGNNGRGASNGELYCYPSETGRNWCSLDLRMVVKELGYKEPPGYMEKD